MERERETEVTRGDVDKPAKTKKAPTFKNPGACLGNLHACTASIVNVARWKGVPVYICECGFQTMSVSRQVYEAAKRVGLA